MANAKEDFARTLAWEDDRPVREFIDLLEDVGGANAWLGNDNFMKQGFSAAILNSRPMKSWYKKLPNGDKNTWNALKAALLRDWQTTRDTTRTMDFLLNRVQGVHGNATVGYKWDPVADYAADMESLNESLNGDNEWSEEVHARASSRASTLDWPQ
jgi:hypothetical protein